MNIPHAKVGQPEQVASLVSYLASPESHFLTGMDFNYDWNSYLYDLLRSNDFC